MPLQQRLLLLAGAILAFLFVTRRVRKRKIRMDDAIFWIVVSIMLVVVAAFPQLALWCAARLGFISASNFVFLLVVGLLLIKVFTLSAELSLLKHKVEELTQEVALRDKQ